MKGYRAIVIDGKRVIKRGCEIGIAAVIIALVAINIKIAGKGFGAIGNVSSEQIINESVPTVSAMQNTDEVFDLRVLSAVKKAVSFFMTFDPFDERTVVFGEIPLIKVALSGYLARQIEGEAVLAYNPENADMGEGEPDAAKPSEGNYPIKAVDSGQHKALKGGKAKILIRNETEFGINIEEMLAAPLKFNMKGEGPKVLILHTHATESYSPEGATEYSPDKSDRSLDENQSVIKVGEAAKMMLEEKGIETVHDKTLHDHPNFNGSYANSLKTVEMYKAKYPSICMVLDIHRDAFIYDDGTKAKFVAQADGQDAAQLMFVVGTNAGGLEHPDWRENMKLALKMQSCISERYPSLMRGVNLRKERFNGHTTLGSLIIEVGASGNSLAEAIRGVSCAMGAIGDFLNTLK